MKYRLKCWATMPAAGHLGCQPRPDPDLLPRNTGEALQMYLTTAVINLFGTGYSFLSLSRHGDRRSGNPAIYLPAWQGGQPAGRPAGMCWRNRLLAERDHPGCAAVYLYPLFVAPTLYFLIRGIRRSNRNDFILAGLSLGIGLHGYTPIRIMPFVIVVAVGLFLIHPVSKGVRWRTVLYLALLALIAFIVFLPLLRFWIENPDLFSFRAFSRLGPIEQPLPGPAWQIFLKNLWNALIMFGWSNGEIWPVSIPYRPGSGCSFRRIVLHGVALLVIRYF
jgi:hypothetical protein